MSAFQFVLRTSIASVLIGVLSMGSGTVQATTYTVGTGAGCTHATLQAAVTAAAASPPDADIIRLSAETFTQQQVLISTTRPLSIEGGYANCAAAAPTAGSRAILDGNGGSAIPVLRIFADSTTVSLRYLTIRRGDHAGEGEGGGIYFEGTGRLLVSDSTIANNVAGYGAGIYARGTAAGARVEFGENVIVSGNTARQSGGGVYVDQATFDMTDPGSALFLNEALGQGSGGFGGGLVVLAKSRDASANIGPGLGTTGSIFNNKAVFGGGVALVGTDGDYTFSQLRVHSPIAGTPAGIRRNVARELGGGLFLLGSGPLFSGGVSPRVYLWNTELDGNSARDGAAIYSDIDGQFADPRIFINTEAAQGFPVPSGFVCPRGQFCGGITDNLAQTVDGTPTDGAVIHTLRGIVLWIGGHDDATPPSGGMAIEGNRGGRLLYSGDESAVRMENVLIADNQVTGPLIHVGNAGRLVLADVTLAGNSIPGPDPVVRYGDGDLTLQRTILWQPGATLLQCSACTRVLEDIVAHERNSLDGGVGDAVTVGAPRFIDPANGDYRLTAASAAVDRALGIPGDDRDALGQLRDQNLGLVAGAVDGVRDVGAFERPSLQPLVLNSDLDDDTRLWTVVMPGAVFHDTLNASGPSGSGSLRVYKTGVVRGQPTIAARQCVHLPGPARYLLNGWGRSVPTGLYVAPLDSTALLWEVRHNGGEDCTGGTISARGTLNLSSDGWTRPAFPAEIDISPADWTVRTSVLVNLVVVDNSVAPNAANAEGWFDGITLQVGGATSGTFADGFE